jgi:hypothetical protein
MRARTVAAATVLTLGAATASAFADTNVPVTTLVAAGTRTLNVIDPSTGTAVGSGGLPLGAGHGGALLVNVTDVDYKRSGYQVSATMTNLYPFANGNYDFNATAIPSSALSLSYPSSLFDLNNVAALVEPVFDLTGSIQLGALGVPVAVDKTVNGTAKDAQSLSAAVTQSSYASLLSQLPITLATGETGTFDSPAPLPGQSGSAFANPTPKVLMSGSPHTPTTKSLTDALNATYGGKTAQQLVTAGLLDANAVISAAAQALGVTPDLITNSEKTTILTTLTGTVSGILSIDGQTGSYNTLPELDITTPSDTPAGLYRGQLTVTLMDK